MVIQSAEEINKAFDRTEPELFQSKYARYPMKYERWLNFQESFEGKPSFVASEDDKGIKMDYVYCKNGPVGKGYYHMVTKVSWVNLYSKLVSQGSGGASCLCLGGDRAAADAHDTTRRIVYHRSRSNRPDDVLAAEQAMDHYAGTKLNPVHGLKL